MYGNILFYVFVFDSSEINNISHRSLPVNSQPKCQRPSISRTGVVKGLFTLKIHLFCRRDSPALVRKCGNNINFI